MKIKLLWIHINLNTEQQKPSYVLITAITTVLAKFSAHCLLSHYFSREAMLEHIIVDDTDSMNTFVLLRGKRGMGAGGLYAQLLTLLDDSDHIYVTSL